MKNFTIKFCTMLFFAISIVSFRSEACFYVLKNPYPNTGMFAIFQSVLCFLEIYEDRGDTWDGITVDFGKEGVYWTKNKGQNWWSYYFYPIHIINTASIWKVQYLDVFGLQKLGARNVPRDIGHRLIQKYIKIKDEIQNHVDKFYTQNLQDAFIIGIHYRGTDKVIEAPRVSYEAIYEKILTIMNDAREKKIKIFVATDEEQFISFMKDKFKNIVFYTNANRSVNSLAVHLYHNQDPYKNGEEALIDCLLLSKCNVLIRTESHLSNTALMFNLDLIPHTLNRYYGQ